MEETLEGGRGPPRAVVLLEEEEEEEEEEEFPVHAMNEYGVVGAYLCSFLYWALDG